MTRELKNRSRAPGTRAESAVRRPRGAMAGADLAAGGAVANGAANEVASSPFQNSARAGVPIPDSDEEQQGVADENRTRAERG